MTAPYYADESVSLFHGDCREVLIDVLLLIHANCLIVDPPYETTSLAWDRWVDGWPALIAKVTPPAASMWCFGSMRTFLTHGTEFGDWQFAQDIVWHKHNGSSFHADRFKRVHEHALQWYKVGSAWEDVYKNPQHTMDATARTVRRKERPPHTGEIEDSTYTSYDGGPRLMRSVLDVRSCHGYAQHPTEKPLGILTPLVRYSCPSGGLVLDPFCGVGSSLVAAKQEGRRAIGIEIDERYCEVAAKRLSQGLLAVDF